MAEERIQRRLAAILAADVVGYSRMMSHDESGTLSRLKTLRRDVFDPKMKQHGGRIFKITGDGALVEFHSAVDALHSATEIQEALAAHNSELAEDEKIALRIGISLGDVIVEGSDLYGNGVNVASRMEALAEPGGICVSGNVHEHAAASHDVWFDDLGELAVKNIDRPIRCYRVRLGPGGETDDFSLPLPDKPSIAVLPFDNLSGDPEQEYFADGIAEDIITALSRFSWFFVIARNSSFSYKGTSPDVRQVAQELGVQYVLEGSVRKAASRVRITAQLIDALTGRHVWAERYDRELDDIFTVQDEITEAIASQVAPAFISAEMRRIERKTPESFDAWDYSMRGSWHLWRLGKDDVAEARRLFETAIALDPRNSLALSGLALACVIASLYGWGDDAAETRSQADEAARRAIAADENDALAHAIFGFCCSHVRRDYDAALRAGRRAVELNPNLPIAEGMLALTYSHLDEYDKAMRHAANAERLSPRDSAAVWWNFARSWAAISAGRYEESLRWAKTMTDLNPDFPTGWRHLAADYAHLGRLDEAREAIVRLQRLLPGVSISSTRERIPVPPQAGDAIDRFVKGLRMAGLPE